MAQKILVIAEKPSAAKDIANGLADNFKKKEGYLEGSRYVVAWARGHLVTPKNPDAYGDQWKKWDLDTLPIIPEKFQYEVIRATTGLFKVLKKLINDPDVESIVNCGDSGREGELIQRLIYIMAGNKKPVKRMWTSEALTPDAVKRAFANLKDAGEYDRLFNSAIARQHADWLVGMTNTRAFSVKYGGFKNVYSIGRVQTATLRIIVDREKEILNFKPENYWLVRAKFKHKSGQYEGLWFNAKNQPEEKEVSPRPPAKDSPEDKISSRVSTEKLAKEIIDRVNGKKGVVQSITKKSKEDPAPLLFSLSVLQQEANKHFGFFAEKTLSVAQLLYEKKVITYPRTSSQYLGEEFDKDASKILDKLSSSGQIIFDIRKCTVNKKNKKVFDSSKLADHHALIPTGLTAGLSPDEQKLYNLICTRFIAAFYPTFKYTTTTVVTLVGADTFESKGKIVLDPGWKAVYGSKDQDKIIPDLLNNDPVTTIGAHTEAKQTTPPARYNDGTLINAMTNAQRFITDAALKKILKETAGLGTEATRSNIIDTIIHRFYVKREGKQFVPTDKGIFLIDTLLDDPIANIGNTALWEQTLDDIAAGKVASSNEFMESIKKYITGFVKKIRGASAGTPDKSQNNNYSTDASPAGNGNAPTGQDSIGSCPECGKDIIETAKGYSCSGYSNGCKFAIWKDSLKRLGGRKVTASQARKLLNNETIKLSGLTSKAGKKYDAGGKLNKHIQYGWQIGIIFDNNGYSNNSSS